MKLVKNIILSTSMLLLGVTSTHAATWYIGSFTQCGGGACNTASNTGSCGQAPTPCATLAYFTTNRRSAVQSGDTIRITGTHTGNSASGNCVIVEDTNLTIEGRKADDSARAGGGSLATFTNSVWSDISGANGAVIDHQNTGTGASPCEGAAILGQGVDFSGLTVSDLAVKNLPSAGTSGGRGSGVWLQPSSASQPNNVVLQNLVVEGMGRSGITVTNNGGFTDNNCSNGWDVTNLTIKNSRVKDNPSEPGFGGISVSCTEAYTIQDNLVQNNGSANDEDGIKSWCGRFGLIQGNRLLDNGEDDIDVGGHWNDDCSEYNWVDANDMRDSTSQRGMKTSGGLRWLTISNNYFLGPRLGLGQCSEQVEIVGNTFVSDGGDRNFESFQATQESRVYNNGIFCNNLDGANECIFWDTRSTELLTNANVSWDYNGLYNQQTTASVFALEQVSSTCNSACTGRICQDLGPAPGTPSSFTHSQLANFQAKNLFDGGDGTNDRWGQLPSFVNASGTTPASFSLQSSDTAWNGQGVNPTTVNIGGAGSCSSLVGKTVATANRCTSGQVGQTCTTASDCAITTDFFGNTRSGAWDIGAHQVGASTPTTTTPPATTTTIPPTTTTTLGDTGPGLIRRQLAWADLDGRALDVSCTTDGDLLAAGGTCDSYLKSDSENTAGLWLKGALRVDGNTNTNIFSCDPSTEVCTFLNNPSGVTGGGGGSTLTAYKFSTGSGVGSNNSLQEQVNTLVCYNYLNPADVVAETGDYSVSGGSSGFTYRAAVFNNAGSTKYFECLLDVASGGFKTCANTVSPIPTMSAGRVWVCLSAGSSIGPSLRGFHATSQSAQYCEHTEATTNAAIPATLTLGTPPCNFTGSQPAYFGITGD